MTPYTVIIQVKTSELRAKSARKAADTVIRLVRQELEIPLLRRWDIEIVDVRQEDASVISGPNAEEGWR